jgi:hypothetical protein
VIGILALPDPLHFQIQKESFGDGIIPTISFAAHATDKTPFIQKILVLLAGILAASEWTINPGTGRRCWIAIFKAAQTRSAGISGAIAQPTTLRANKSSTMAKYSHPEPVRM